MAAYGSQTDAGQVRSAEAHALPRARCSRTRRCGQMAREACRRPRGEGRRAARLRERGDDRPEGAIKLEYVIPDQTILIENPAAVTTQSENPEAKALDWLRDARGAEDLRRQGVPAGAARLGRRVVSTRPPRPFTIDEFGGWQEGEQGVLRHEKGSWRRSRRTRGVHCRWRHSRRAGSAPPGPPPRGIGGQALAAGRPRSRRPTRASS